MSDLLNAAFYGLGAFLSAFAALAIMAGRTSPSSASDASDLAGDTLVFLIRDGVIVDLNFSARRYLDSLPETGAMLDRLRTALASQFRDAGRLLSGDTAIGDLSAKSLDGTWQALRETSGKSIRLKVVPQNSADAGIEDIHRLNAMESELVALRANTNAAPFLAWRENRDGQITWVNRPYLDLVDKRFGPARRLSWPLPNLFSEAETRRVATANGTRRMALEDEDRMPMGWFDCSCTRVGSETLFTAFNADETVRAERQLRDFTQTLTKTFADLSVGLAVFDRTRQLALFNPALTDLSSLPVDFLTARPTLEAFLDGLRERRIMPEPKNYRSWRSAITDLESAVAEGGFNETWNLPDNRTYRISGHPHADGAIALLFEDISDEMALTRRFRSELELQHAVFDTLDEAVATFSASGTLTMANRAYHRLWNVDEPGLGETVSVIDATRIWHAETLPTPVWGDFREFVQATEDRGEWTAHVRLHDGRAVECRFSPAPGGTTLALFRVVEVSHARDRELRAV